MSSSIHFRFKSVREFETLSFEGDFLKVGDLKVEIVQRKKLNFGEGFDLEISDASTGDVFKDENALVQKNTSVIVRRIPGLKQGGILSHQEMAAKNERYAEKNASKPQQNSAASQPPNASLPKTIEGSDEAERIASLVMQSSVQYDQFPPPSRGRYPNRQNYRGRGSSYGSGRNTYGHGPSAHPNSGQVGNMYPDRAPRPSHNYVCHRCNKPGHWIDQCPTNGDPTYDKIKVRAPTGIPRSMLRQVDAPESGTGLQDSSGHFVTLQPNEEEFARQTVGLRLSQAAAAASEKGSESLGDKGDREDSSAPTALPTSKQEGDESESKTATVPQQTVSGEPKSLGTGKEEQRTVPTGDGNVGSGGPESSGAIPARRAQTNEKRPENGRRVLRNMGKPSSQMKVGHVNPPPGMGFPGLPMPNLPPGFPPLGLPPFPPGMPPPPPHVMMAMMANGQGGLPPIPPGMMPGLPTPYGVTMRTGDEGKRNAEKKKDNVDPRRSPQAGREKPIDATNKGIEPVEKMDLSHQEADGDGGTGARAQGENGTLPKDSTAASKDFRGGEGLTQRDLDRSSTEKVDSARNSKSESLIAREPLEDSRHRMVSKHLSSDENDYGSSREEKSSRELRSASRSIPQSKSPRPGRSMSSDRFYRSPQDDRGSPRRRLRSSRDYERPHEAPTLGRKTLHLERKGRRSRTAHRQSASPEETGNGYGALQPRDHTVRADQNNIYPRRPSPSPPRRERRSPPRSPSARPHRRSRSPERRRRYPSPLDERRRESSKAWRDRKESPSRRRESSKAWRDRKESPSRRSRRDGSHERRLRSRTPPRDARYQSRALDNSRSRQQRPPRVPHSPPRRDETRDVSYRKDGERSRRRHEDRMIDTKRSKRLRSSLERDDADKSSKEARHRDRHVDLDGPGFREEGRSRSPERNRAKGSVGRDDTSKRERDTRFAEELNISKRRRRELSVERAASHREERRDRLSVHDRLGQPLGERKKSQRRSVHDRLG